MGNIKFTNFATSTIADVGGIAAGDLAVNVQAGDGALFPSLTGSQYFFCVLIDTSGNREIVKVTARATDALTIVRAQDNTNARAFAQNDKIELRTNAAALELITDLNGEELILDADGDSSLTADTDDQLDLRLGGTDRLSFKTGAIEPVTDDNLDLGASGKQFKDAYIDGIAYIDEFDIEGTYKAALPTNDVGADAKFMLGDANTIIWFYMNTAPPGWSVLATGADTVLGVAGGAQAYNVAGGSQAGTWTGGNATLSSVQSGLPAHNVLVPGRNVGQDYDDDYVQTSRGSVGVDTSFNISVPGAAAAQPHNHGSTTRIAASVGKLFQLDVVAV